MCRLVVVHCVCGEYLEDYTEQCLKEGCNTIRDTVKFMNSELPCTHPTPGCLSCGNVVDSQRTYCANCECISSGCVNLKQSLLVPLRSRGMTRKGTIVMNIVLLRDPMEVKPEYY